MSDKPKLARHVTVGATTYSPGDHVPDDVREQIRNPLAFVPMDGEVEEPPHHGTPGTAGGHRLASSVMVGSTTYGPDDPIPDDVARQITNPRAWKDGKVPTFHEPKAATPPKPSPAPETPGPAGADTHEPSKVTGPTGAPTVGDDKASKPPTKRA